MKQAKFTNWEKYLPVTCTRAKLDIQNIQNKRIIILINDRGKKRPGKYFNKEFIREET